MPRKIQVATYVLSLSHNFSTGWTTALIHGESVMTPALALQKDQASGISGQLHALIMATPILWAHPLLLPTILLKNYIYRAELFVWMLDDQVVDLESSIGVTFAGRLRHRKPSQNVKLPTRSDMRKLTMGTHTTLTDLIFSSRVLMFSHDCAAYLLKTGDELKLRIPSQHSSLLYASRELQDIAKYMEFSSGSMQGFCSNLKERVHSQIQVLYSISAQTDNRLSARIAVSSGRDSTAMKTLAFITAFFLPGTYIATLFSMSMFEWQGSSSSITTSSVSASSSPSYVISANFWIYWAITIPLTIAVIIGWRLWWVHEDRAYTAQLAGEMDGVVSVDDDPDHKGKMALGGRPLYFNYFIPRKWSN